MSPFDAWANPMPGERLRAPGSERGARSPSTTGAMHDRVVPDDEVLRFGEEAARRLASILGPSLVGAYFVGSVALGDYVRGRSDIDIAAVSARVLSRDEKTEVVGALSHPHLLCPARGLELVIYLRSLVELAAKEAAFEVNLDTGPGIPNHVGFDPDQEPWFWFVIDRAIAHERGVRITGPPPSELFAPIPPAWLIEALSRSIGWHRAHRGLDSNSVLNACRAWRYAEEGVLTSKADGASWAARRWREPSLIQSALRVRPSQLASADEAGIAAFLDQVETVVDTNAHP